MRKKKEVLKNMLVFVGENCGSYNIPFSQIVSFTIDGMDFKEFLATGAKRFSSYKLVLNAPILLERSLGDKYENDFPHLYDYNDFVDLTIYTEKEKYEFDCLWEGTADYYTYAQALWREGKQYIYSFDRNRKPTFFQTSEVEAYVRNCLDIPATRAVEEADVLKIEDLNFSEEFLGEIRKETYEDLKKFSNVREIDCEYYISAEEGKISLRRLAECFPMVETIFIDDYFEFSPVELTHFKRLQKIHFESNQRAEKTAKFLHKINSPLADKIPQLQYVECATQETQELERVEWDYSSAKSIIERYLCRQLITEEESAAYLERIKRHYASLRKK